MECGRWFTSYIQIVTLRVWVDSLERQRRSWNHSQLILIASIYYGGFIIFNFLSSNTFNRRQNMRLSASDQSTQSHYYSIPLREVSHIEVCVCIPCRWQWQALATNDKSTLHSNDHVGQYMAMNHPHSRVGRNKSNCSRACKRRLQILTSPRT